MKNILYLLMLIVSISYSQDKIDINAIINQPYEFKVPQRTYVNVNTTNTHPIYMPRPVTPITYRLQDPLESTFIRNAINIETRSSLNLTPIVLLKDIDN